MFCIPWDKVDRRRLRRRGIDKDGIENGVIIP
jgi:hypothetical protein